MCGIGEALAVSPRRPRTELSHGPPTAAPLSYMGDERRAGGARPSRSVRVTIKDKNVRRARCGAGLGGTAGTTRTRGWRRALRAHGGAASPPTAAGCRQRSGEGERNGTLSGAPGAPIRCAAPTPQLGPVPRAPSHEYRVSPSRGRPVSTPRERSVSRPAGVRELQPCSRVAWGRCWG